MKSLQFPAINQNKSSQKNNLSFAKVSIPLILAVLITASLILFQQYYWALAFTFASVITNYAIKFYDEVNALDFSVGDIDITMEDIVQDMDY